MDLAIRRSVGKLIELDKLLRREPLPGQVGIGHTRWATHGRPSETNAHPHLVDSIAVVHNGIIENYLEVKEQLLKEGHKFSSETDTEIVSHLIAKFLRQGLEYLEAVRQTLATIRGSYALGIVNAREPRLLVAARKESPLILGLGEGEYFLASDIPAILPYTRRVIFLEDHDLVVLRDEGFQILGRDGQPVERQVNHITWSPAMAEKAGYKHFMQKEIFEQPRALIDTFRGRINPDLGEVMLEEVTFSDREIKDLHKIFLVACGTSYHAAMVGKFLIEGLCRLPVEIDLGSEFRYRNPLVDSHTLLIPISQSGETADTRAGLSAGKALGAKTLAIVNAVGSSIAREADSVLYTHAGPEIGVASTKAFTTQLVALYLIALFLASRLGRLTRDQVRHRLGDLLKLPTWVQETLEQDAQIRETARQYMEARNFLYLGRRPPFSHRPGRGLEAQGNLLHPRRGLRRRGNEAWPHCPHRPGDAGGGPGQPQSGAGENPGEYRRGGGPGRPDYRPDRGGQLPGPGTGGECHHGAQRTFGTFAHRPGDPAADVGVSYRRSARHGRGPTPQPGQERDGGVKN